MTTKSDAIRSELEKLRDKSGRISREVVFNAARNPRHPLHHECHCHYTHKQGWETHCLERAQELIVRYVSVVATNRRQKIVAPAYVRDPTKAPNEQGHIALTSESINQQLAEGIMTNELERCGQCIERARAVVGILDMRFPGLAMKLEGLLNDVVGLTDKLRKAA